jgi:CIC family chloride channel protein
VEARAGLIDAAVGELAWFLPPLVGGGQEVTQRTLAGAGLSSEEFFAPDL